MTRHGVHLVTFHLAARRSAGWRATIPARNGSVIRCTSSGPNPNSWAIWALDRFKPMKYKHKIYTRSG